MEWFEQFVDAALGYLGSCVTDGQATGGSDAYTDDTIGVAPDHQTPMTAADLSAGRDPGVAKALTLLR
jgi:hypothetical protein